MVTIWRTCHHFSAFKMHTPQLNHQLRNRKFYSGLCVPHHHSYRTNKTLCRNLLFADRGVSEFHRVCEVSTLCHSNSLTDIRQRKFSQPRFSTDAQLVTLDTVFSESNRKRLQDNLLTSVNPSTPTQSSSTRPGHAAVLVPLCTVNGEPSLLFTLRSTSLRQHRGQVSFPGGKADETDRDVIHTALRETQEELGIAMETVDVWGTMMELPTRDKKLVTPVVGHCGEMDISSLTLSEDEVELVFTRTVKSLCDPKNVGHTQFRKGYTMPVFLGGEHRIWGLTSFILHQVLTYLAPGLYTYKLRFRS